jgi:hypothetical protein
MSKSDPDIYAKIGGDPAQARVLEDASPLDRETPPSLADDHGQQQDATITEVNGEEDWSLAYIERQSVGTTVAFVAAGHLESGDEPGTITVPNSQYVIRRDGTANLANTEATVLSLQRVANSWIDRHTSRNEQSGELVITSDPFSDSHVSPRGDGDDPLYRHGDWFVCRDANDRDRSRHNCYETYLPAEALQFRDAERYDRPPVLIEDEQCIPDGWDGPSGDFGVISTEVVRVSDNAVPASDERMREIEHNAQ